MRNTTRTIDNGFLRWLAARHHLEVVLLAGEPEPSPFFILERNPFRHHALISDLRASIPVNFEVAGVEALLSQSIPFPDDHLTTFSALISHNFPVGALPMFPP